MIEDSQTERFLAQAPALMAELERRAADLFGLELSLTRESLAALEQLANFLRRMDDHFDAEDRRVNVLLLGVYLGEIVRREGGGQWRVDARLGPLVRLPDGRTFSPILAVQARLREGEPPLTG